MKLRLPQENNVTIVGRLTRDPELRYTQKGQAVCRFDIAVNRRFRNSAGEWQDETSFIPVVVWRDAALRCNERAKKGLPVYISGRLRSRTWEDKDGQRHNVLEIYANRIQFLAVSEPTEERLPEADEALSEEVIETSPAGLDEDVPF